MNPPQNQHQEKVALHKLSVLGKIYLGAGLGMARVGVGGGYAEGIGVSKKGMVGVGIVVGGVALEAFRALAARRSIS
jgi:hypothetical protein